MCDKTLAQRSSWGRPRPRVARIRTPMLGSWISCRRIAGRGPSGQILHSNQCRSSICTHARTHTHTPRHDGSNLNEIISACGCAIQTTFQSGTTDHPSELVSLSTNTPIPCQTLRCNNRVEIHWSHDKGKVCPMPHGSKCRFVVALCKVRLKHLFS